MGVFDSFIKPESERKPKKDLNKPFNMSEMPKSTVAGTFDRYYPRSFADLYPIIDALRLGRSVIVYCTELKEATAVRVLDILAGATYALQGSWQPIVNEVFVFTPNADDAAPRF